MRASGQSPPPACVTATLRVACFHSAWAGSQVIVAFHSGIPADVPFAAVEIFQRQDYDEELLLRLLVERIECRLKFPVKRFDQPTYTGFEGATHAQEQNGWEAQNEKAGEGAFPKWICKCADAERSARCSDGRAHSGSAGHLPIVG